MGALKTIIKYHKSTMVVIRSWEKTEPFIRSVQLHILITLT